MSVQNPQSVLANIIVVVTPVVPERRLITPIIPVKGQRTLQP